MKISEQRQGAVLVLKPEGALVEQECADAKTRLIEAVGTSLGRVVVDMSAVPFVDSRGLELLVDLTEELGKSGQSLRLCGVNKTVREVMDLTELTELFEHFEDSNTAVRSFL
jgi:anti-sigma B factor antagonist